METLFNIHVMKHPFGVLKSGAENTLNGLFAIKYSFMTCLSAWKGFGKCHKKLGKSIMNTSIAIRYFTNCSNLNINLDFVILTVVLWVTGRIEETHHVVKNN